MLSRTLLELRPVSIFMKPLEWGVISACLGLALQLYLTAQMYRQLRELVRLHRPAY